jgi:hypothetical protein
VRSRSEATLTARLLAVMLAFASAAAVQAQPADAAASAPATEASSASAVSAEAVEQVVQQLRDEEHFGRKQPERYLRFKKDDEKDKKKAEAKDGSGAWWRHFIDWLSSVGRVGVWTLGALGVALVVVLGLRARRQGGAESAIGPVAQAPQRVRQYDIRPESLPDDVGGVAWGQWQSGDRQAALALLYRGALSRLVHRHAVPIRTSSTEGDCMGLAALHASGPRSDFFAQVAHARLLAVYAGRWPEDALVRALCAAFEASLASPPPPVEVAA